MFSSLTRIKVTGLKNVPSEGGAILAINHLSRLDSPLVFMILKQDNVTGLIADNYQSNPFLRWIIEAVDGIWINREQVDLQALRQAQKYLENGGYLGVAPEGTRSDHGALIKAKIGTAYLADRARVPVIPVAITGTEKISQKLARLQRPRLTVEFGQPIHFSPLKPDNRNKTLEKNTDEIMCQIALMLPETYRGVYADHPRLKELIHDKKE